MIKNKQLIREFPEWAGESYAVGPGWQGIIYSLCSAMRKTMKSYDIPEGVLCVDQIKEKFGTLRFYYTWLGADNVSEKDNDLVFRIIDRYVDAAETWSEMTCEECGAFGVTRPLGWRLTLCDKHYKEKLQGPSILKRTYRLPKKAVNKLRAHYDRLTWILWREERHKKELLARNPALYKRLYKD